MLDLLMIKPFEAAATKSARAKKHLQEFTSEIDAFLERDAVQVVVEIAEDFKISYGICVRIHTGKKSLFWMLGPQLLGT
jgi:hypothetical protein